MIEVQGNELTLEELAILNDETLDKEPTDEELAQLRPGYKERILREVRRSIAEANQIVELQARVTLQDRVIMLEKALKKYGQHTLRCGQLGSCICGWAEAQATLGIGQ